MKGLRWKDCDTDAAKWQWHAEVYACRRLVLDDWGRTSPCDEDGKWFDPMLVERATERMRHSAREGR